MQSGKISSGLMNQNLRLLMDISEFMFCVNTEAHLLIHLINYLINCGFSICLLCTILNIGFYSLVINIFLLSFYTANIFFLTGLDNKVKPMCLWRVSPFLLLLPL